MSNMVSALPMIDEQMMVVLVLRPSESIRTARHGNKHGADYSALIQETPSARKDQEKAHT